jgi:hypothetical protein
MLKDTLDGLDDAGSLEAGGDDEGVAHSQRLGVVAHHGMRTPADVDRRVGVLHFDGVFLSFIGEFALCVLEMGHCFFLLCVMIRPVAASLAGITLTINRLLITSF